MLPRNLDPRHSVYSWEQIHGIKKLNETHHKVAVNLTYDDRNEAIQWAALHLNGLWSSRNRSYLVTVEEHKTMRKRKDDPRAFESSNWVEDMMSATLAEELSLEIDREILKELGVPDHRIANHWFFFERKEDALKFSIRWGLNV